MSDVKWIKLSVNLFDDDAIKMIDALPDRDAILVIWLKLLVLAGQQNNSGVFIFKGKMPYTDEMLSAVFNRPLNTVRMALEVFETYGMVEIIDNVITLPNWEKHQSLDKLEARAEYMKTYMADRRAKQKALISGDAEPVKLTVNLTDVNSKANVNVLEEDIEEDIKNKNKSSNRFTPPSIDDISAYITEKGLTADPGAFYDYYASKNWMVGKNKMSDWKAALRGWSRREKENAYRPGKKFKTAAEYKASGGAFSPEELLQFMEGET